MFVFLNSKKRFVINYALRTYIQYCKAMHLSHQRAPVKRGGSLPGEALQMARLSLDGSTASFISNGIGNTRVTTNMRKVAGCRNCHNQFTNTLIMLS